LSAKRYGISDDDWEAWLDSRRLAAVSEFDEEEEEEALIQDIAPRQVQDTVSPAPPPDAALQTRNCAAAPPPRRETLEEKIKRAGSQRSLDMGEETAIRRQASPAAAAQPRRQKPKSMDL
jgi:hypothetical protein